MECEALSGIGLAKVCEPETRLKRPYRLGSQEGPIFILRFSGGLSCGEAPGGWWVAGASCAWRTTHGAMVSAGRGGPRGPGVFCRACIFGITWCRLAVPHPSVQLLRRVQASKAVPLGGMQWMHLKPRDFLK